MEMFDPLPDKDSGLGAWYSSDIIDEDHVRNSVKEAIDKQAHAQSTYDAALRGEPDPQHASHYASNESKEQWKRANLARIQAVLLAAAHIEGVVNAWGTVAVTEPFYKQHLERLPVASKVALLLALGGRGLIPHDHPLLLTLSRLFERRNALLHRKTRNLISTEHEPPKAYLANDLQYCLQAIDSIKRLLHAHSSRLALLSGYYGETMTP